MPEARMNAHKVFHGAPEDADFWHVTQVPDPRMETLRGARDTVRDALRNGFKAWQVVIAPKQVVELAYARAFPQPPDLTPRFRGQGSATYHTLNEPAHLPPQQVDFDDGVFLPVAFLQSSSLPARLVPAVMSHGYFAIVEAILKPLCEKRAWTLDSSKPSCVRVQLDSYCHLDIALYAVPDNEFDTVVETAKAMGMMADQFETLELADRLYRDIPIDKIMLAHRVDGWKPSDPRLLEDWFQGAVDTHGQQLRRICRYLKAWRDYRWKDECRLSSIALMKCVVDAYDQSTSQIPADRDDLALLYVARKLPDFFGDARGIANPVIRHLTLNDNWGEVERVAYVGEARTLVAALENAVASQSTPAATLAWLTSILGARIPKDEKLVVLAAEAAVKVYAPARVAAPQVPRTTSG